MGAAKCMIKGSDYIGVFVAVSEKFAFLGSGINRRSREIITSALKVTPVEVSVFATDLAGLFIKCNSNGIVVSNIMEERELSALRASTTELNIEVIKSGLNAVGNNIIANDKIAIINPEYDEIAMKQIADALGVEVVRHEIAGFKTVGANNILTNSGFVINNRATDHEKEALDKLVGFDSIRTTANTGSLNIGLSAVCNSKGVVVGDSTTGYELTRITEALEIND